MNILKKILSIILGLENAGFDTLENLKIFFFQNPAYTVFDRAFHGLSKLLFGLDLANDLRGKN